MSREWRIAVLASAGVALTWAEMAPPLQAQFSPKCQLNGRQVFCAMTLEGVDGQGWRTTTVVLADDTLLRWSVRQRDCRAVSAEVPEVCPARLTLRNGQGRLPHAGTHAGTYRLRRMEGGVTHHYQAGPVDLRFFYMD